MFVLAQPKRLTVRAAVCVSTFVLSIFIIPLNVAHSSAGSCGYPIDVPAKYENLRAIQGSTICHNGQRKVCLSDGTFRPLASDSRDAACLPDETITLETILMEHGVTEATDNRSVDKAERSPSTADTPAKTVTKGSDGDTPSIAQSADAAGSTSNEVDENGKTQASVSRPPSSGSGVVAAEPVCVTRKNEDGTFTEHDCGDDVLVDALSDFEDEYASVTGNDAAVSEDQSFNGQDEEEFSIPLDALERLDQVQQAHVDAFNARPESDVSRGDAVNQSVLNILGAGTKALINSQSSGGVGSSGAQSSGGSCGYSRAQLNQLWAQTGCNGNPNTMGCGDIRKIRQACGF